MKRVFAITFFIAAPAFGFTNQIDFSMGRGSPLDSIQAQGSSEQDGLRGSYWSLDALHHASDRFYLGFGTGHFSSADNNSSTFAAHTNSTISSHKTPLMILGRMDFGAESHFVPYAIVGLGWVKNSLTVTSDQGTLIDQSKSTLGYSGGLGMDIILGDRLLVGLEARYEGSPAQHFAMTSLGAAASGQTDVHTSINLFSVGLKAGVRY